MHHIKTQSLNLKSILIGSMLLASFAAFAQYSGPTSVYPSQYQIYTFTLATGSFVSPVWTVSKGTVEDSYVSSDRLTATVAVIWTTTGSGYVKVTDGGNINPANYNVTVNTCPTFGSPTAPTVPASCAGNTVTLNSAPGTNGNTVFWFATSTSNPALYQGNSYTTPALTGATTHYIATGIAGSSCVGSRTAVTINPSPNPAPIPVVDLCSSFIYISGSTNLNADVQAGTTVRWYAADTGGAYLYQGNVYTTPTLTVTTDYYATLYNTTTGCESTPRNKVTARVLPFIAPVNTKTEAIRVEGISQDNQLYALNNLQKTTAFTHFDGLARANQSIVVQASPATNDIVQITTYDALGHAKSFLPYTATTNATGAYHSSAQTEQAAFYNTPTDNVADDIKPFTVALFESSPLSRVLESGSVGNAFQPGTTHTTRYNYSYNTGSTNSEAEEVRLFNNDGTSTGFYPANQLSRTMVTDADGNIQIVFTDARGRVMVRKRQLDEAVDNSNSTVVTYAQTYYVYDEFDRLKYMVSPKGVAALRANGWNFTANILKAYVYQFVYDKRGRLVEKKVPGQAWMYYGYDRLNRLVLAQDSLLRGANKWIFVKYDKKGRTVMQGLYTNATYTTRSTIQTNVLDPLYANATDLYYEARGTAQEGYTNQSFPTTGTEVWSVSYFDSYDTNYDLTDECSYTAQGLANELPAVTPYNMPTASKRIILGTTTWLYTYVFYDKFGRTIQVKGNNHMRATVDNVQTSVFDFEGKLLTSKAYHNTGVTGGPITAILKYTYDAATQTRLTTIEESINGSAYQEVVSYTYNELGQLVDKKLHKTGTSTYLQSVDYRYTIRGQLKSINNSKLSMDNGLTNDDTNDYFGMELLYNDTESTLSNTALYNGNASAIKWKALGMGNNASGQRSYTFAYDKTGQLKTASYKAHNGTNWSAESGAQDEIMAYDLNGNIRKLVRHQRKHQLNGLMALYKTESIDSLIYTYSSTFGDRLLKVEEAATANPLAGFNNGTTGSGTDYTYDNNGNLTADQNKTITSITYNYLNKPATILFTDGRKVEYVYDATGTKLTMKTYKAGAVLKTTTQYVGGFLYENDTLRFFGSPEGRVVYKGGSFEYQYSIADHQGNTRVVLSSVAPTGETTNNTLEGLSGNYQGGFVSSTKSHGGTKSLLLNGGANYEAALGKSYKVYPGDKLQIDAWALYKYPSANPGSSSLVNFATYLLNAFALSAPAGGETGTAASGVNGFGGWAAAGFGDGSTDNVNPRAFINILLFDKNYKFLDVAYLQLTGSEDSWIQLTKLVTVKEEGYAYLYVSNENATLVDVYFDDVVFTRTPSNIVQYNEYYPFGMQTSSSWTRTGTKNNFLYDAGGELNSTTGFYDLAYRNYDATVGRFFQVDPLAVSEQATYQYAGNNPVMMNDPLGASKSPREKFEEQRQFMIDQGNFLNEYFGWIYNWEKYGGEGGGGGGDGGGSGHWTDDYSDPTRDWFMMSTAEFESKYEQHDVWTDWYVNGEYVGSDYEYSYYALRQDEKTTGPDGLFDTKGGDPFGFQDDPNPKIWYTRSHLSDMDIVRQHTKTTEANKITEEIKVVIIRYTGGLFGTNHEIVDYGTRTTTWFLDHLEWGRPIMGPIYGEPTLGPVEIKDPFWDEIYRTVNGHLDTDYYFEPTTGNRLKTGAPHR